MPRTARPASLRARSTRGGANALERPGDSSAAWRPSVTVAAVIEREGRFLLVEEMANGGMRLNQPAGHLDPGESLLDAAARETLEETAYAFTPTQLIGIYLWRAEATAAAAPVTYLRFAFVGELGERDPERPLDQGIVRALWLTKDEIAARAADHRSPLVQRCIDDYLRGERYPIDLLYTHPSALVDVAPAKTGAEVASRHDWTPAGAGESTAK
jgi:8-oxo-dGTP pyrophosphatase MutT (NUDIX family)